MESFIIFKMKKKITKIKTIEGNTWYYLAEADEIDEERESPPPPPLSDFERFVLSQSVQATPEEIAFFKNNVMG